jgi:methyl-accepting chemotaxis protein
MSAFLKFEEKATIGARLGVAFGALIVYTLIVTAISVSQQNRMHETLRQHDQHAIPTARLVQTLTAINAMQRHEMQFVQATSPSDVRDLQARLMQDRAHVEASLDSYRALLTNAVNDVYPAQVTSRVNAYLRIHDQIVSLTTDGQRDAAIKLILGDAQRVFDVPGDGAQGWAQQNEETAIEHVRASDALYYRGLKLLLAISGMALISAVYSGLRIRKTIVHPVRDAAAQARRVARGDLTQRLQVRGGDEVGDLFVALNEMTSQLSNLIADVVRSAAAVEATATTLTHSSLELSQRTQYQATHLRQTAASMAQITQLGKSNSDNAANADQLGTQARELAQSGGEVVTQAVGAMSDINKGSAKIANIIGLIDEIAFQTNLLALNAAVEAARAGEQGRGFAVVASEVRALARRSADAAKQIKTLITESAGSVRVGTELVDRTGDALSQIQSSVLDMTTLIKQIAHSSHEQAIDAERISEAMRQLDGSTEQYTIWVEQGSSAAQTLREQADVLAERATYFTLEQGAGELHAAGGYTPRPQAAAQDDGAAVAGGPSRAPAPPAGAEGRLMAFRSASA